MIPLLLAPIAVVSYILNKKVEDGTIKLPEVDIPFTEGPWIPDPFAGVRDMMEKMTMMIVVGTVSMIAIAITFTVLYPKWK